MTTRSLAAAGTFLVLFAGLGLTSAYGQYRAGIQGTVTDPTGATVKGAKVTVTSQETGVSQHVTSGDTGFYSVGRLTPGLYTVTVSLAGFKTGVTKDLQVAAESTRGLDLILQLGALSETVTVNGSTLPTLDTESASLTGTISERQVAELPRFRGDPYELLRLTPGVFGLGARDSGGGSGNFPNNATQSGSNSGIFQVENAPQLSANGARVEANGYQLDGVSTNSQGYGGTTVITPNTESVKELKVEVSPYSAENANSAGAIFEVISKNGTNNFHGSAVLRNQSPGLNAFQRRGVNGAAPSKNTQLLHNYLGSLGGPIVKDKLFVFFSFERFKKTPQILRASTQTGAGGDFVETSQYVAGLTPGSLAAQIYAVKGNGFSKATVLTAGNNCAKLGLPEGTATPDGGPPVCQTVAGGVDIGSPTTAGGFVTNVIRTDPTGSPFYSSSVGGGLDGIPDLQFIDYDSFNDASHFAQYNGRIDFNVTQKDLVAFSLFVVPRSNSFLPGGWQDGRQNRIFNSDGTNETAAVLWSHTINPNTINEARMNVTRWFFDEHKANPQTPFGIGTDTIQLNNLKGSDASYNIGLGVFNAPGIFYQTKYVVRDTLSKVHGSHVLRFGGEFSREQNTSVNTGGAVPSFDFNNLWSFAKDAPNDEGGAGSLGVFPWAGPVSFNPKTGTPTDYRKYFRTSIYGFFGQDTWKAKPNLTVTLGLRYDYFSPLREKFGNISNLALGQGAAALTGAKIKIAGDFTNPDRNNFSPQLGFAWSPGHTFGHEWNNRFVLRGGIGVGYNRPPNNPFFNSAGNPPFFVNLPIAGTCKGTDAACDRTGILYALSSGGIYSFSGYPSNPSAIVTFDPVSGLPQPTSQGFTAPDINGVALNLKTPYAWHYSLEGEYDLGHNWGAAISYQGSQSRKNVRLFNEALVSARPTVLNPFTGQTVNQLGKVTILRSDVNGHYNALLARLNHHSSNGLEFTGSYRYSKNVDQCSGSGGCNQTYPFDQRLETGPADYDVTHSFTANALYELPFFKSRHDWLYTLAGGWKLDAIVTLNSGFPWTPISKVCQSLGPNLDQVCDGVRPAAYNGKGGSNYSTSTFLKPGGNFPATTPANANSPGLDYFTPAVASGFPVPGVGRNAFRGPRYTGIDMSFGKRFTLPKLPVFGEDAGFELRASAFNVFNKLNLQPFSFRQNNTNIADPSFGRATSAYGGRVFEFIGRFSF